MMLIIVILTTIGFAASGGASAQVKMGGQYWILGTAIGALVGFVTAAILAAYFFLLAEIAENTRRIR